MGLNPASDRATLDVILSIYASSPEIPFNTSGEKRAQARETMIVSIMYVCIYAHKKTVWLAWRAAMCHVSVYVYIRSRGTHHPELDILLRNECWLVLPHIDEYV